LDRRNAQWLVFGWSTAGAQPVVLSHGSHGLRHVALDGTWHRADGSEVEGILAIAPFDAVVLWPL
jgi:hypothetical protein